MFFELKKLTKSKLRIVALLILLLMPIFTLVAGYQNFYESIPFPVIQSIHIMEDGFSSLKDERLDYVIEDGVTYKGLDAIRRKDEIFHQYAGNLEDGVQEKLDAVFEEKLTKLNTSQAIDEEKMTAFYDENWKEYYEKCKRGELTQGEYLDYDAEHNATLRTKEQDTQMLPMEGFRTFYTDAYTIEHASLRMLYEHAPSIQPFHQTDYLITKEKLAYMREYNRQGALDPTQRTELEGEFPNMFHYSSEDVEPSDEEIDYLNTEFLKHPMMQEGMLAQEFMISCMDKLASFLPSILVLFGILFSSLFNQEYRYKTDQLLRGMKIGNAKQAITKCTLCTSMMMGYALLTLLLIWIVPHILIGYHSLDGFSTWIWSYREQMVMVSVLFAAGMFLYSGILCLISAVSKSMFSAFLIFLLCIGVGCMEQLVTFPFMTQSFLGFLPSSCFITQFYPFELVNLFGILFQKGYLVIFVYIGIGCLCSVLSYHYYRKRDVKNA